MTFVFDAPDPESVPVRDAATVMLLRDGPHGVEVQMLRRNLESDFVGGAYVFPGGAVDPADSGPEVEAVSWGRTDASASALLGVEHGGLAYWVAAIRESFEEAGLLLAVDEEGVVVDLHADAVVAERFVAHRRAVDAGELGMAELCRQEGLRLAVGSMQYFSRWITPLGAPRRYDTRFLVARAPAAQTPLHDDREVIASLWIRPEDALARHAEGNFELIFPTVRSLEVLRRFECADDVIAHAASATDVGAVLPTIEDGPHGPRLVVPGDGEYDAVTSRRLDG